MLFSRNKHRNGYPLPMIDSDRNELTTNKILIAMILGFLGFVLSQYGLEFKVDDFSINLPWSMLFPIMASMSFGWKYALVASLSGGALYPFLLWPTNGWPNLTTTICYTLFFMAIGLASHPRAGNRLNNQIIRLIITLILFAILLLGYYAFVYEAIVKLNPPFWSDNVIATINNRLLYTFFLKDIISFTLLTIAADTFLRAPIIRRFLSLKLEVSQRQNNYVILATIFGALIIWTSLFALSSFLIDDSRTNSGKVLLLALFIILASSFIIARILIHFTEKHQTFKADILEREKTFRNLVANIPGVVFRSGTHFPYPMAFITNTIEEVTGHNADNFLNDIITYGSLIHPDDRRIVIDTIQSAIENKCAYELTNRLKNANGEWRWVFERGIPQFNKNGTPIHLDGVILDITERRRIEDDIKDSEKRAAFQKAAITELVLNQLFTESDISVALQRIVEVLSTTLGIARSGVWSFDEDADELQCLSQFDSESRTHSCGLILAANKYPSYFQVFKAENRINAEDAQNDPRTHELAESYLKKMGITSILDVGIFNEGKLTGLICCEHKGAKRKWYDDEESFVSTVSAIVAQLFVNSKRKQAEEALRKSEEENRSIVEVLPDMLFKLGKNGRYIDIKTSSEEDLAGTKNDLLNKTIQEVLPPFVSSLLINSISKAIATNETQIIEYKLTLPTGEKVFEARVQRLNEDEALAFVREITDQYEMQKKLKESEENYRELFNNNHFPTLISDFEGRILFYNQYTVHYFEIDTNRLDEIRAIDFYDNPEQRKEFVERLKQDGYVIKWEVDIKTGTGHKKTALVSTNVIDYKGIKALQSVFSDITERKAAENALRESESRFHDALEYMAIPIGISSGDKIIFHNQQYIKTFGYTIEDVPILDVLTSTIYPNKEYREFVQKQWNKDFIDAIEGNTSTIPRDYRIRCKNGVDKLVTIIGRQVGDVFVNVFHDITEKKAAEEALRESERRFHDALEYIAVPVGITVDDKIIHYNRLFKETYGYTPEDVPTVDVWMSKAYPNDEYREFAQNQWLTDVKDAIAGKTSTFPRDYKITCKNGEVKLATVIGRQVGDVFVAVFQDITQRRTTEAALLESEERYRTLFETANDAIFMISDGRIFNCNKKTSEIFGYPEEEINNMTPWELSPKFQPNGRISIEMTDDYLSKVIAGKPLIFNWKHIRSDKSEFDAEVSLNLLPIQGKKIILAIVRDVSERVRLEQEAQLSLFRGEENERSRVAKDLHDGIGPLLSTCKIYLHTFVLGSSNQKENHSIEKVSRRLDDALASVREISNNLSPHLVKNFGLINALKHFTGNVAFSGKINLSFGCDANIRFGEVVETSLYRVITELINNTIKYANAKTISIEFDCKTNSVLKIRYQDDGNGFDMSKVTSESNGHGLNNIRSRINGVGGILHFQSSPNEGVNVLISIKY